MLRRTKIIATLGPATDPPAVLEKMISSGVDLVRVNLSHGSHKEHQHRIEMVKDLSEKLRKEVGIIVDLQGPKIRIARFKKGSVELKMDATFIIDPTLDQEEGDETKVGVDYKNLPKEVFKNDILVLDDGRIILIVEKIENHQIYCKVKIGGRLSNNKGINRQGGGLTAPALTEKDKEDIKFSAKMQVDYVAVSFPRNAEDIQTARTLLTQAGSSAGVIAKIERAEAITQLDEIIEKADASIIARGDLGIEIGYAELPAVQKMIIERSYVFNRPVIVATQMLESMIHNPIPTRAEVSDVANAVLEGTDAVLLSGETATGNFPLNAIATLHEVCLAVEKQKVMQTSHHRLESHFVRIDESIAMGAMYIANHMDLRAILALTETGSTPLWMSRIRSAIPIYGLSRHKTARGRMTLYRGVYPIDFDVTQFPKIEVSNKAIERLLQLGAVVSKDRVLITKGDIMGNSGGANTLKVVIV